MIYDHCKMKWIIIDKNLIRIGGGNFKWFEILVNCSLEEVLYFPYTIGLQWL